jgi:homopolymeric O-antigen transport system ATP-binding protein
VATPRKGMLRGQTPGHVRSGQGTGRGRRSLDRRASLSSVSVLSENETAIRTEGLRKRYRVGGREGYRMLRDSITRAARAPFHPRTESDERYIWALDGVSFAVARGEIVGVIGPNGAGKSTLLKILSRITEPTEGRAELYGRVGSLLEIGTGFHLELTGRENVFLNGTILGMTRGEIARKLDDIVEFAGVQRFLDTPLKFFSSGMQVRLGFAVAAFLEPEILVIDEVLTVGDLAFQERSLGKMKDVASGGRTVLFVSHAMSSILALCPRSMLLSSGKVLFDGPSEEAVARYVEESRMSGGAWLGERTSRTGTGTVRVTTLRLEDVDGNLILAPASGEPVRFVLEYEAGEHANLAELVVNIVVSQQGSRGLLSFMSQVAGPSLSDAPRTGRVSCFVPQLPLMPGHYNVQYSCLLGSELADKVHQAGSLVVGEGDFFGTGRLPPQADYYGPVLVPHEWSIESTEPVPDVAR